MIEEKISKTLGSFSNKDFEKEVKRLGIKIRRRKSERRFLNELKKFEEERALFVSDKGFAGNYLKNAEITKIFFLEKEDLENVKKCKILAHKERAKIIIGFGGGRALDIAKKTAYDMKKSLILIPTAPSHNGLISRTASLYDKSVKKSFTCKFPKKVIVPFFMWKNAKRHIKAGILDVLASATATQDVFLSHKETGERIKEKELKLSLFGVKKVLNMKKLKDLEIALFSQGIAMKESSRYCSGSEHEAEKTLAKNFKEFMHGELIGVCSLIVGKIYSEKIEENLLFDSSTLFEDLLNIYRKVGVIDVVKGILEEKRFIDEAPEFLKDASEIRPERFTLWNVIDTRKINFKKIILEIRKVL